MSFPGYVFGSSPPVSTRSAEDREPASTVPGSASPEGTYLAPSQEAVSSAPIDDLFSSAPIDNLWHTVPVAFSEARFQVKKSACFWRHGRYQE